MLNMKWIGAEVISKKLDKTTVTEPLQDIIRKVTLLLGRRVQEGTPVDEGRLRAGIAPEVKPLFGRVYTNVKYAPFVEEDTSAHWPPWGPGTALHGWAIRHGFPNAFLVARAISQRGTTGKHMFEKGLEKVTKEVPHLMRQLGTNIENKWRSRE
jgi:hypothetical protein